MSRILYALHDNEVASMTHNPFRIRVWSTGADQTHPILVVVNQENQVLSWEVPLTISIGNYADLFFKNTSRTLCHSSMKKISRLSKTALLEHPDHDHFSQQFLVSLTTQSDESVDVHIAAEEEKDFHVREDVNYTLSVTASESRYVYYKFDKTTETVMVQISSSDDVCLAVSVQDSDCPVFDLNENIKYEGKYQSMTRKGALTVTKNEFEDGFFLVFIARPDNYECNIQTRRRVKSGLIQVLSEFPNRTSTLSFKIRKTLSRADYVKPILIIIGIIFAFFAFAIILVYLFFLFGSVKDVVNLEDQEAQIHDELQKRNTTEIKELLETTKLNVKMVSRYPVKTKKRSFNYLWHVLSVSIFYGIPVVQLVTTYQRMVNKTGNQDLCYYNFFCAHPLLGFSDFNHIFSNIAYILLGGLFMFVVLHRHNTIPERQGVGIPEHYGIYYAMGVSLIIEGLLSACYHICPSQSNYQFDTSFMYVMAVLCSVKLYQNRHSDINATAYSTFTILGLLIFVAMIGILHSHFLIWLSFYVGYIGLCLYLSFKIYFLSYVIQGFKKVEEEIHLTGLTKKTFTPNKKVRFVLLILANGVNMAMLLLGLCLYSVDATDFGSFLLLILLGNAILHTIFYTCMKLIHGERLCIEAIVYGILSLAVWTLSALYFFDKSTLWMVTPAESRNWNQECVLLEFFDKHDIWHLLSAPALYFTFMLLLCLDDDLVQTPQESIPVF
ncbi:SID1 transmembrane family member 1-like isoform X2 [Coccinella septempunctata]|uniref:SID1 transmembrane family member 1-like isoform X2 n=1 Tax=Coccinella septempunctata TaxID=41139 RepID=UPI001D0635A2|nr:SID1 transmembrane family member 1-like isoform X2 [Coccinella septempunctata]